MQLKGNIFVVHKTEESYKPFDLKIANTAKVMMQQFDLCICSFLLCERTKASAASQWFHAILIPFVYLIDIILLVTSKQFELSEFGIYPCIAVK